MLEFSEHRFSIEAYPPNLKEVLQLEENHRADKEFLGVQEMTGGLSEESRLAGVQEDRAVGVEKH